jgi:tmRNA-binding protein
MLASCQGQALAYFRISGNGTYFYHGKHLENKVRFFLFQKREIRKSFKKKNEEGTRIIVWKVYATLHARNPY